MLVLLAISSAAGTGWAADPVPNHAVVLIYHHVAEDTPASTSLSPALFAAHLDFLAAGGYRVRRLEDIVASLQERRALDDLTVGLSFDDGYRSVYTEAFPRLQELGWPFTVFVCPADIDAGGGLVMTWDQLREMASAGATIASHGLRHRHLQRRLPGETTAAWRDRTGCELAAAEARLEAEIGTTPRLLAYPYGESDPDLQELVAGLGWVAFGQQSGALGEDSDFTLLPRFAMAGTYAGLDGFGDKVGCLPLPVVGVLPRSPLLPWPAAAADRRPVLTVTLRPGATGEGWRLSAFASGQGAVPAVRRDGADEIWEVRGREAFGPGRARYNLTAPYGTTGRFWWYSRQWIVGDTHGD